MLDVMVGRKMVGRHEAFKRIQSLWNVEADQDAINSVYRTKRNRKHGEHEWDTLIHYNS
jgi:hypothetical protein